MECQNSICCRELIFFVKTHIIVRAFNIFVKSIAGIYFTAYFSKRKCFVFKKFNILKKISLFMEYHYVWENIYFVNLGRG